MAKADLLAPSSVSGFFDRAVGRSGPGDLGPPPHALQRRSYPFWILCVRRFPLARAFVRLRLEVREQRSKADPHRLVPLGARGTVDEVHRTPERRKAIGGNV